MVNVALVTIQYPPTIGGLQAHIKGIVELIEENGHNVHVFTSKPNPSMKIDGLFDHKVSYLPVSSWIMDSPIINPFRLYRELKSLDPDIVHVVYPFPLSLDVACLYAKLHRKKLVCTYIDDIIVTFPTSILISLYEGVIWKMWMTEIDAISASSVEYAKGSKGLSSWVKDLYVVPPPVFNTGYNLDLQDKYDAKKRLGLNGHNKVVLFVGGLRKRLFYKRPDILIQAWAKYIQNYSDDSVLVVVGDGECKNYYMKLSENLGLSSKNIIFTGYVSREKLEDYYLAGDIFILPSQDNNEAFGITAVEALLYGNVAIVSDIPGFRGSIGRDRVGISFVYPSDIQAIVNLLRHWTSEKTEDCAIRNNEYVRQSFSKAVIRDSLEKLYRC